MDSRLGPLGFTQLMLQFFFVERILPGGNEFILAGFGFCGDFIFLPRPLSP